MGRPTRLQHAKVSPKEGGGGSRGFSTGTLPCHPSSSKLFNWTTSDFISAHNAVRNSGKYNFQGCRIPVPTNIIYDRIEEALGEEITVKERRVLELLKFGMPINCSNEFGIKKLKI